MTDIQTEPAAPIQPRRPRVPAGLALAVGVAVVIAGVAGGRILLRHKPAAASSPLVALPAGVSRTGRNVPVAMSPLPNGLQQQQAFVCDELSVPGGYTAIAERGRIVNISGTQLSLAFRFDVWAGSEQRTVSKRFQLPAGGVIPSVAMASETLPGHLTQCALAFLNDAGYDPAKSQAVRDAATAAGCGMPQAHPIEGRQHVDPPAKVQYKTTPPTSGAHYLSSNPLAPTYTGVHTDPIQNEVQVHNLEHGHVGVQYRGVSQDVVNALIAGIKGHDQFAFVAPYPTMPQQIALTAWGVSLDCQTAPSDATKLTTLVQAFIAAYSNHAPESIPGHPQS